MGLYALKPWFTRRLRRCEDVLVARRVSPNTLTVSAVVASVLAGGAIAAGGVLDLPALWLLVPPLVLVRLALNALDGSVARRTRAATPYGAALNEVGDRLSDAAVLGPIAFAGEPMVAAGAVAASWFASSTGVLAQACAGARDRSGPMGKADRAAVVAAGALGAAALSNPAPLIGAAGLVLAGSVITGAVRFARLRRGLRARLGVSDVLVERLVDLPGESSVDEETLHALAR